MYLRHPDVTAPYVNCDGTIESLTTNVANVSGALQATIDNVQDISNFIESYINCALIEQEERITRKIADKTYDVISEIIECNIRKEEFIRLLLDEISKE